VAFPAIAAAHEGYKVFAVVDASGTYSKMAEEITLARIVQAGVVPMDTAAVASELQKTWNREDANDWAEIYAKIFPSYQLVIESYMKARQVEADHQQLDAPKAA
jgi:hypothetical protein